MQCWNGVADFSAAWNCFSSVGRGQTNQYSGLHRRAASCLLRAIAPVCAVLQAVNPVPTRRVLIKHCDKK